jgi:hypothetical protein
MSIAQAEIGQTYIMGNSYNPETCKVTYLVGFADLPESAQRAWTQSAGGKDPRTATYVWYDSTRKHGNGAVVSCVLPSDVFCACAFYSLDTFHARPQSNTGAGLLCCTLPGER